MALFQEMHGMERIVFFLVTAVAAVSPGPCEKDPGRGQPWCDISLTIDERVRDLVSRIPDADVPGLMTAGYGNGGSASLGMPAYQWWNEGLHGLGFSPGVNFDSGRSATSFPQVVTTSMSFNTSLFHAIGAAISTEARAFSNQGHAGLTIWTPNINIFRDPRWGRGQETPGEDPMLTASYAFEFVRGMQDGHDPAHLKTSACLKHFAAYDLEKWGGIDRHHFNAVVSDQDLAESFNAPFEAGVRDAGASCIMCSYNEVNGIPSCANKALLTDLARNKWGFDGYITSDCEAVRDILSKHNYTRTPDSTNKAVLQAGMDIDCGSFLGKTLNTSLLDGSVSRDLVNMALSRLFRVRMRLGQFDPPGEHNPYSQIGMDHVNTPAHQQLALEAARQGIVLLKNAGGVLPLHRTSVKTIAVVGPGANGTAILQGNYAGVAPSLVSIADGLRSYAQVSNASGCWSPPMTVNGWYHPEEVPTVGCVVPRFEEATALAAAADVTVIVVGLDQAQEAEDLDRTNLELPGLQRQLAEKVAAASKGPVVLVVMAGGSVDVTFARDSNAFSAILFVGYPGQAGGTAIAETIFGDNNPSGRLTQTFYPANYINEWKDPSSSYFDMSMRPNASTGNPGRGYRFYAKEPVFAFGAGLSYTSFAYDSQPVLECKGSRWPLHITIQNTGTRHGRHIVLAFAVPPGHIAGAPQKMLRTFSAIELAPGAKQTLTLTFTEKDFHVVDRLGNSVFQPGQWYIQVGDLRISALVPSVQPTSFQI